MTNGPQQITLVLPDSPAKAKQQTHTSQPVQSIFDRQSLDQILGEIQQVYLRYAHLPICLGFSHGKDSTAALQLLWEALGELPLAQRTNPVYVICSDTMAELPDVLQRVNWAIERINAEAQAQQIPITAHKVMPRIQDTLNVCVIGYGYAFPTQFFRYCQSRLKATPSQIFVKERVQEHGRVIMLLGLRETESATRGARMRRHTIPGTPFQLNASLRGAYVYAPLARWTTDDVWTYLLQRPSPWGGPDLNRNLAALYRQASGMSECPLVVDRSSPSCGNSRFGCWNCTVSSNRSLEALVDVPENDWMVPLWDAYTYFKGLSEGDQWSVRELRILPDGQPDLSKRDGRPVPGRYKIEVRLEILRRVLAAQVAIRRDGPDPEATLITPAELFAICELWRTDTRNPQLPQRVGEIQAMYRQITGIDLDWPPPQVSVLDHPAPRRRSPRGIQTTLSDFFF